jgi:hypothetical protein
VVSASAQRLVAGLAAAALAACQGGRPVTARERRDAGAEDAASPEARADGGAGRSDGAGREPAAGSGSAGAGGGSGALDEAPDPGKQIAALGAISAWQAVVDRAQLLARRGQRGVVYGVVGAAAPAAPSPYRWLIDDTEGHGALGIRIALGAHAVAAGARIAARGSWSLDEDRRWIWRVEAIEALGPAPAPARPLADPLAAAPGHVPAAGPLPAGARPIRQAKEGDAAYFQLAGPPPAAEGDGWLVAGQLGEPPAARLILPGERPSYGAQDLRAAEERWQLRRQQTYWVRLGRIRPQPPGEPPVMTARTAPIRVQ